MVPTSSTLSSFSSSQRGGQPRRSKLIVGLATSFLLCLVAQDFRALGQQQQPPPPASQQQQQQQQPRNCNLTALGFSDSAQRTSLANALSASTLKFLDSDSGSSLFVFYNSAINASIYAGFTFTALLLPQDTVYQNSSLLNSCILPTESDVLVLQEPGIAFPAFPSLINSSSSSSASSSSASSSASTLLAGNDTSIERYLVLAGGAASDGVDFGLTYMPRFKPQKYFGYALALNGLAPDTTYVMDLFLTFNGTSAQTSTGSSSSSSTPTFAWWRRTFSTRIATTQCQLAFNDPECPRMAYATFAGYSNSTVSTGMSELESNLAQYNCHSLPYSQVRNCTDCREAYRDWGCAVWVPRCLPASFEKTLYTNYSFVLPNVNANSSSSSSSSGTGGGNASASLLNHYFLDAETLSFVYVAENGSGSGRPVSPDTALNAGTNWANVSQSFVAQQASASFFVDYAGFSSGSPFVLPCSDLCYNVMQSCPSFLMFLCPQGIRVPISQQAQYWVLRDYGTNLTRCNRMSLFEASSAAHPSPRQPAAFVLAVAVLISAMAMRLP